ncbi:MAG TPA: helix-turn-helix transcriptional regulator [Candidatus Angelobacter sp.]|jgi:predicted transcriptional regulator|nr:helix-turn-helix transcriptional regulator [Candidatus Angelobacter sp.]
MTANPVRELRRRADLTQIALARTSGVPRSRIQLAEAGELQLRSDELQAIREAVRPSLARAAQLLESECQTQAHAVA